MTEAQKIRIVLIDDHGLCRRGLSELLEHRAGMQVLGAAGTPEEAEAILARDTPDLIIMDLRMPPMDGLTLLKRLRDKGYATPVVILTMSDAQEDLASALRAGVRGYLLKDMDPDDVLDSIRRAAKGELVVAPVMAIKLTQLLQPGQKDSDPQV